MKKAAVYLLLVLFFSGPVGLASAIQEKVDLNKAEAQELEGLPGVGPALAKRIIDNRQKNGPFRKIEDLMEDLMNVRGFGSKKFAALEKYLMLSQPAPSRTPSKKLGTRPPL